jgi:hypothetical protein
MTNPHPDTERLRYEIEAKTRWYQDFETSAWPNTILNFNQLYKKSEYYNSLGKCIAIFRLKAWK